ncbi:unnamed protein product [Cunninghamella blakesleeana]
MITNFLLTNSRYQKYIVHKVINTHYTLRLFNSKGDNIHGYEIKQVQRIDEIDAVATVLEHKQTGAEHLHIHREDNNNIFAVGFSTPVNNSTGVAHVLEHTTLCGSTRYPTRDPFFKMLNRSYSNYMNALTGSDYTLYPFATTNFIDYENLQNVYMDAVLHPLLDELDFKQEGWRLEYENTNDTSGSLDFKGVVYNEMKGRVSDRNFLHFIQSMQALHPGTTYSHSSGGDPKFITDLTYTDLCEYQKNYYHPSNAKFYTYGNFPLEEHLAKIHAKISGYNQTTPPSINKITPKWSSPRKVFSTCALDPHVAEDKQSRISISFLTNDIQNVYESFALRLLSILILEGHSSPMYKALIESQLGSAYSVNVGYNQGTRISSFTVGLQGVNLNEVDLVEKRILEVLEQIKRNGFDKKRIDAALHQMELTSKHKTAKFGLTLMHSLTPWFNGANPIDLIGINKHIYRLRNELQTASIFETLIDKYLLRNKHRLTFIMHPDVSYTGKISHEEKNRLSSKTSSLTNKEKQLILEQSQLLSKKQNMNEDLSCLPTLHLNDIQLKQQKIELEHMGLGIPVQWRNTSTNGITYVKVIFTLPQLADEIKQYVPLFCGALKYLGTKTQNMADLDDKIRLSTGGIGIYSNTSTDHSDLDGLEESIIINGNCLNNNVDKMCDLMVQLIQETNFDNTDKLKTLIKSTATSLNNSIINSGHVYASSYSSSTITPASASNEMLYGLSQIKFMNELNKNITSIDNIPTIVEKLKYLSASIIHQSSMRLAIICGEEVMNENISHLSTLINRLPKHASEYNISLSDILLFNSSFKNTFHPIQSSVNFSARSLRGVHYTHPDSAKLQVLSSLLTSHYLHREIREKNGAYGGGSTYDSVTGILTYYSYRDPKLMATINTYQHAFDWIMQQNFTDQDMTEAKLSIFKRIDAPIAVSSEGMIQFVHGISDYMRQNRREQLLKVTQDDIKHVANIYLNQQYSTTILGNENSRVSSSKKIKKIKILDNEEA